MARLCDEELEDEESESEELSMAGKMNFGLFSPEKQSYIILEVKPFRFYRKSIFFDSFLPFGKWKIFLNAIFPNP